MFSGGLLQGQYTCVEVILGYRPVVREKHLPCRPFILSCIDHGDLVLLFCALTSRFLVRPSYPCHQYPASS